jgi:hypothetical protein
VWNNLVCFLWWETVIRRNFGIEYMNICIRSPVSRPLMCCRKVKKIFDTVHTKYLSYNGFFYRGAMIMWYQGVTIRVKVKVKCTRYRPCVAQSVGRGIVVLFHDRGTRRGWVVSSTPWLHFISRKDPVPILQEAGWAPGSVWTGGKSRFHRDSIPDRPARSQSLYRLSYPAQMLQTGPF